MRIRVPLITKEFAIAAVVAVLGGAVIAFPVGGPTASERTPELAAAATPASFVARPDEPSVSPSILEVTPAQQAAAAVSPPIVAAPAPPPPPPTYAENVWAYGFQAQLNACRGAVVLTRAYGVPTIGEKWGCGGARFPGAGSLVQLGGVMGGTWRVGPVVAVLNAYVATTAQIPRGYQLLYQTCRGGSARTETFTVLTRVG